MLKTHHKLMIITLMQIKEVEWFIICQTILPVV